MLRTLTLLACVTPVLAFAQQFPCDNATSGAYGGGWTNGTNGGFGFGPWVLTNTINDPNKGGHFRASSNGNGANGGPGIDIFGHAWGMYANSGNVAKAERAFILPVVTGDTVSFDLDTGFIDNGSSVSVAFFNGSTEAWRIGFTGGGSDYWYSDAGGVSSTGLGFTDGGLHVDLKLTGGGGYLVGVTRLVDNAFFTTNGILANGISSFTSFEFVNVNAGSGPAHDAYFNQICVVPEPGSFLLAGGLLALVRRRGTRKGS
ncbi:MAG: PEP-CTERM sorting domain-containing protein [Fimbriimonadaceae bacterium]|nr:PEP-CTERM sorting domain-containing protein [Fimbriimonadaceae bacterium]QYK55558.1 MAG: PEP-CTERM sorting domain-containing protein [Fimbriimonadaceae bacterium]